MATRRTENGRTYDHGAQYFTVRDDRFARYVHYWMGAGWVQPWHGRIVELNQDGNVVAKDAKPSRYVGVPGMSAIAKHLASDLNVRLGTTVGRIRSVDPSTPTSQSSGAWQLEDLQQNSLGVYDLVIVNCPPDQAVNILPADSSMRDQIGTVSMQPCWCLMLECEGLRDVPFEGAFLNHGPLSWIARNDSKPGRSGDESITDRTNWVLHASAEWSQTNLETDPQSVADEMLAAFQSATRLSIGKIHHQQTHRWKFANTQSPLPQSCLWDPAVGLGVCGDWCGGPRVEGAFLSGAAMAGSVLRHLTIDRVPA